jgi:predicted SAM-dependent methyltransferase
VSVWHDARVHLGCGSHILLGWVNTDAQELPGVDVVLDLCSDLGHLPTNAVTQFYASHIIEHIAPDLLPGILRNLCRVLRPGGKLTLATTSLEGIFDAYLAGYTPAQWNAYLFGDAKSTDSPLMAHRQTFTEDYLIDLLQVAGFDTTRTWGLKEYPEIAALNDCAGSSHHVTLYLEGVKDHS